MKVCIASDLHGSAEYAERIKEVFLKEGADLLVLLGDIYNHGPRNPLPEKYSPMDVARTLNGLKEKLIVIKGNCDSEVDAMISEFDFVENTVIVSGGKTVFCTHGHVFNEENMPKTAFDAVIYGHFHVGFIKRTGKTVIANPGSVSLPKMNSERGYLLLSDGVLTLKALNGDVLAKEIL